MCVSEVLVKHFGGTFYHTLCTAIWGSFGARVTKLLITRKWFLFRVKLKLCEVWRMGDGSNT